jgi:hypothetical protein
MLEHGMIRQPPPDALLIEFIRILAERGQKRTHAEICGVDIEQGSIEPDDPLGRYLDVIDRTDKAVVEQLLARVGHDNRRHHVRWGLGVRRRLEYVCAGNLSDAIETE